MTNRIEDLWNDYRAAYQAYFEAADLADGVFDRSDPRVVMERDREAVWNALRKELISQTPETLRETLIIAAASLWAGSFDDIERAIYGDADGGVKFWDAAGQFLMKSAAA